MLRSNPCLRLRLRLCLRLRLSLALRLRLHLRRLLDLFVNRRLPHRKPQALLLRAIRVVLITITVFRMCHASGGGNRTRRQHARRCMWQSIRKRHDWLREWGGSGAHGAYQHLAGLLAQCACLDQ